ncbi:MAG TPA: hypothetical protein VIU40_14275 [Geobacteraceae bacterium]
MSEQNGWDAPEPERSKGPSRYVQPKNWLEVKEGKKTSQVFRFRALASPVVGTVVWSAEGKPCRFRSEADIPADFKARLQDKGKHKGKPELPKTFWAFPCWDYEQALVKVYEMTQESLRESIRKIVKQWGPPTEYDLVASREMVDGFWTYSLVNQPPKPLDEHASAGWAEAQAAGFDLARLFDGGDPFSAPAAAPDAAAVQATVPF